MSAIIRADAPLVNVSSVIVFVDVKLDIDWNDNELENAVIRLFDMMPGVERTENAHGNGLYLTVDYTDWIEVGVDVYRELLEHTLRSVEAMTQLYTSSKEMIEAINN